MKIAVVTDSNSGITQAEGEKLGIFVIPMPFMIDGETYEEDISLTQEEFYGRLKEDAKISTSQPSPETVMNLWDQILKEYDGIVHIPMSSGLSSSCQTAVMLAEDYGGKVRVVNNRRISITQRQAVMDAMEMAALGMDAGEIGEELERSSTESSIYITIDTLKYLKRGGRVTPAAAALGTLLRIKPVLQIQGEKLDAFSKARTMKQAKTIMLSAIAQDLKNRFDDPEAKHTWIAVAHTCNYEAAREFADELKGLYPKTGKIIADPLSLSVACHIGPGALAVAVTRCLSEEIKRRGC
ncbi:DegV family protein [Clostridiaceae bacterium]|nr:DegV family protein [Clostridiaceae bacterium]RKI18335.1 DegV family protein [bacterium 1XD21-70]